LYEISGLDPKDVFCPGIYFDYVEIPVTLIQNKILRRTGESETVTMEQFHFPGSSYSKSMPGVDPLFLAS
jgi:hypothetical protein